MNIYIGNISYDVDEEQLKEVCEAYGNISTVTIIKDKVTGRSKGFGFIEVPDEDEGKALIDGLNDSTLDGRTLTVNEARPRTDDRRGGGGGGGRRY